MSTVISEIQAPAVDGTVSEEVVMKSNAGYYVGTAQFDECMGWWLPYARYGRYYKTAEEAEKALKSLSYVYSM